MMRRAATFNAALHVPAYWSVSLRCLVRPLSDSSHSSTTTPCLARDNPRVDQNMIAWGYVRVGHAYGELASKAVEAASQSMVEKASPSSKKGGGGSSALDFFDPGGRVCLLCDLPVTTTSQAHTGRYDHQARVGVVERALAVIHTTILDSQKTSPVSGYGLRGRRYAPRDRDARAKADKREEEMLFRQPRTPKGLLGVEEDLLTRDADVLRKINFVDLLKIKWWESLDYSIDLNAVSTTLPSSYCRLSHLSSSSSNERKWRLRYLLDWLKFHGILQSSLSIANANISPEAFSRSQRFEALEMVGDNIVKVELPDRLTRLFPHGVCNRLSQFQRLIDSNSGLLDIYDWLKLDQIIGAKLANSKAKADVVESVFGELQCVLWATEHYADPVNAYPSQPTMEWRYVRAVVLHTMHELMHAVFMWRLEAILQNAAGFIHDHALEFKRHRGAAESGKQKRVQEKDRDRGRYETIPLLTAVPQPLPLTGLSTGELWYHSTHLAPTKAGAHCCIVACLSPTPLAKHQIFVERLESPSLVRVKDSALFKTKMEEAQCKLEELKASYSPTRAALNYPQWRREEERSVERQILHEGVTESLYGAQELRHCIERCLRSLSAAANEVSGLLETPDFTPNRQERSVEEEEAHTARGDEAVKELITFTLRL